MLKKAAVVLFALIFVGCGLKSDKKPSQKIKKDYIAQGIELLAQKDISGALKSFDTAIKKDPENLTNYIVLSQVYFKLQNYKRSADTLAAGLRLAPQNGEIYFLLAVSLSQEKENIDSAILAAQKSTELFIQQKNEEGLKKAVNLLRILKAAKEIPAQI